MHVVAPKIMEDYEYAAANVRVNDGVLQIKRDIVLAYMSRHLLYLGTYLKYHDIDLTIAATVLEQGKMGSKPAY